MPSSDSVADTVTLHARHTMTAFDRENVYFAFPSGRLDYDCVNCGSKCCRGFGYLVGNGQELLHQLERRPQLRFFVDRVEGNASRVLNAAPACFFLADDGRCEVHVESGYAAKPETCRLFPFNFIRTAGPYLVVAPHISLCPLAIGAHGDESSASSHATLFGEMARRGIEARIPECEGIVGDLDRLIALERRVVELCKGDWHARPITELVDAQQFATRDAGFPAATSGASSSLYTMRQVLGLAERDLSDSPSPLGKTIAVMTPFLRSQLVFVESRAADASHTNHSDHAPVSIEHVPKMVLAAHVLASLASQAGMRSVTFQSVSKLFSDYQDLLYLLAHTDVPIQWREDVQLDLSGTQMAGLELPYLRFARALLPARQRVERRILGDILLGCETGSGLERIRFLKLVAARVRRHATSSFATPRARPTLKRVKAAIQRWGLENISAERLADASTRRQQAT